MAGRLPPPPTKNGDGGGRKAAAKVKQEKQRKQLAPAAGLKAAQAQPNVEGTGKKLRKQEPQRLHQRHHQLSYDPGDASASGVPDADLGSRLVYPTHAVMTQFARDVGMDPQLDAAHMWICHDALDMPLPPGWQILKDPDGHFFYQNVLGGDLGDNDGCDDALTHGGGTRSYVHPRAAECKANLRKQKLQTYMRQGQALNVVVAADAGQLPPAELRKRRRRELAASLESATLFYRETFGDPEVDCVEDRATPERLPAYWDVSPDDVARQLRLLGIRPEREPQVLWVARAAAAAPLPPGWQQLDPAAFRCEAWAFQPDGFVHEQAPGTGYFEDLLRSYREEYGAAPSPRSRYRSGGDDDEAAERPRAEMQFRDGVSAEVYAFDFVRNDRVASSSASSVLVRTAVGAVVTAATADSEAGGDESTDSTPTPSDFDDFDHDYDVGADHGGGSHGVMSISSPRHHGAMWEAAQAVCGAHAEAVARADGAWERVRHRHAASTLAAAERELTVRSTRCVGALGPAKVLGILRNLCAELAAAEVAARLTSPRKARADRALERQQTAARLEFLVPVLQEKLPEGWSLGVAPPPASHGEATQAAKAAAKATAHVDDRVFFVRGTAWPAHATANEQDRSAEARAASVAAHLAKQQSAAAAATTTTTTTSSSSSSSSEAVAAAMDARSASAHARKAALTATTNARAVAGGAAPAATASAAALVPADPWWPNFATWAFPGAKKLRTRWVRCLQKRLADRVARRSSNRAAVQARVQERQELRRQAERDAATAATAAASPEAMLRFRTAAMPAAVPLEGDEFGGVYAGESDNSNFSGSDGDSYDGSSGDGRRRRSRSPRDRAARGSRSGVQQQQQQQQPSRETQMPLEPTPLVRYLQPATQAAGADLSGIQHQATAARGASSSPIRGPKSLPLAPRGRGGSLQNVLAAARVGAGANESSTTPPRSLLAPHQHGGTLDAAGVGDGGGRGGGGDGGGDDNGWGSGPGSRSPARRVPSGRLNDGPRPGVGVVVGPAQSQKQRKSTSKVQRLRPLLQDLSPTLTVTGAGRSRGAGGNARVANGGGTAGGGGGGGSESGAAPGGGASLQRLALAGALGPNNTLLSLTLEDYVRQRQMVQQQQQRQQQQDEEEEEEDQQQQQRLAGAPGNRGGLTHLFLKHQWKPLLPPQSQHQQRHQHKYHDHFALPQADLGLPSQRQHQHQHQQPLQQLQAPQQRFHEAYFGGLARFFVDDGAVDSDESSNDSFADDVGGDGTSAVALFSL